MPGRWGYLDIERRAGEPIPGRPPVTGPRWRPLEWHNTAKRPKDMAAYRRQFQIALAERSRTSSAACNK
jgi:hypothetical protein